MNPMTIVLAVALAGGILLIFGGIASRQVATPSFEDEYADPALSGPQNPREAFTGAMDAFNRVLTSRPRSSRVADNLARADLKLRVSEYALAVVGLMLGTFAVVFLLNHSLIVAVAFAAVAYFVPGFYVKYRQRKRFRALNNQLGDTILLLSNALKAGYSFAQAVDTVAKNASPPIADEFTRAVREMNLGGTIEESLGGMVKRIESDDLDLMVTAVAIHRTVGGNLAEILDNIAFTIRERVRIKGQIATLTASAKSSGQLITGLPIILAVFMYFATPTYFQPMTKSPIGWAILGAAGFMIFLGNLVMGKVTAIEV